MSSHGGVYHTKQLDTSSQKDEIDSLGLSRSGADSGSSGVGDGVLTSLLNEMDGVETLSGVVVVAATNRPDSLVGFT